MRTTWTAVSLVALAALAACKDKPKTDESPSGVMGSASGTAKPDDMKPEPVAKEQPKPAEPAKAAEPPAEPAKAAEPPAASGDDKAVRPPTAADLAEYTKDLKGSGPLTATIETTAGAFHCELFGDKSPATVANFVGLATGKKPWLDPKTETVKTGAPFYNGIIFHRVIPGFMIQGGDPQGVGTGGPGYQFKDEVNNGLEMKPGTLAMANAGPDTNGSQFFITEGSPSALNGHYSIFGQCKEVDLVKKIEGAPRNRMDRPDAPVSITKITIAKG